MDEYEQNLNEMFVKGQKAHEGQVNDWIKGRENALNALYFLGMTAARFEAGWRSWLNVVGKRRAIKACKKLKKQVAKTQAAVYEFMSAAI